MLSVVQHEQLHKKLFDSTYLASLLADSSYRQEVGGTLHVEGSYVSDNCRVRS